MMGSLSMEGPPIPPNHKVPSTTGPKWQQDLDQARQYMFTTHKDSPPPLYGEISSDDKRLPQPDSTIINSLLKKLSSHSRKIREIIRQYRHWKDFDEDIEEIVEISQKLQESWAALECAVTVTRKDDNSSFPPNALEIIQSCKITSDLLIEQLAVIESGHISVRSKIANSDVERFEDSEALVDTFSKRARKKLHKIVLDIQYMATSVSKDFDSLIRLFQTKLSQGDGNIRPIPYPEPPCTPNFQLPPLRTTAIQTCKDCTKIFLLRSTWPRSSSTNPNQPTIYLSTSFLKLYDSATNGCHFCRLQVGRLLKLNYCALKDVKKMEVRWWKFWCGEDEEGHGGGYRKDFRVKWSTSAWQTIGMHYFVTRDVGEGEVARKIAPSTNSRESFAIGRQWIKNCVDNHKLCKDNTIQSLERPTRLILIDSNSKINPRLVEQRNVAPSAKYMTLSHRWGDDRPFQLTTMNYDDLLSEIPLLHLPRVFKEAISVARRIGVLYLWIDCLCIMQDSVTDWQNESSRMKDIYSGSWCNIAATAAQTSNQPLHATRNSHKIKGCIIKTTSSSSFKVEGHSYGARTWENSITHSPLMNRGWVFQEITLAPRTIHYTHDRLFWQCKTQHTSEYSPQATDMRCSSYETKRLPNTRIPLFHEPQQYHGPQGWGDVVKSYTACSLTFPAKDKLIAISGVAKLYGSPAAYILGLFLPQLIFQLPWRVLGGNPTPENYQAPSWSWASRNDAIIYSSKFDSDGDGKGPRSYLPAAKVVDVDIIYKSEDRFGGVESGELVLSAPLMKAHFEGDEGRGERGSYPLILQRDANLPFPKQSHRVILDVDPSITSTIQNTNIFILPTYFELDKNGVRVAAHTLIVERVGQGRGVCKRIGVLDVEGVWHVNKIGEACFGFGGRDWIGEDEEEEVFQRAGRLGGLPLFEVRLV